MNAERPRHRRCGERDRHAQRPRRRPRRRRRAPTELPGCDSHHGQQAHGCRRDHGPPLPGRRDGGVGSVVSVDLLHRAGQLVFDLDARVADVLQTPAYVPLQAAAQQAPDAGRRVRRQHRVRGIAAEHLREGLGRRRPGERRLSGQQLVEHDAEGPDVGLAARHLAAGLLGAHVGGGAHHRVRFGDGGRVVRSGLDRLGEAEVQHLHAAVRRHLDVGGLQIAVDDALVVRGLQRLGDLERKRQRFGDGQRASEQTVGERLALHQLQHQHARVLPRLHAVDGGDVGVVQRGENLRLALQPGQPLRVLGEIAGQCLDGDVAVERGIAGAPHFAHPAPAQQRHDLVVPDPRAGLEARARDAVPRRHRPILWQG